jgi:hypothetical protein
MILQTKELIYTYISIGIGCSISFWITNIYTLIFNTHLYNKIFETNVTNIIDIRTNIKYINCLSFVVLFLWPYTYPLFFTMILIKN